MRRLPRQGNEHSEGGSDGREAPLVLVMQDAENSWMQCTWLLQLQTIKLQTIKSLVDQIRRFHLHSAHPHVLLVQVILVPLNRRGRYDPQPEWNATHRIERLWDNCVLPFLQLNWLGRCRAPRTQSLDSTVKNQISLSVTCFSSFSRRAPQHLKKNRVVQLAVTGVLRQSNGKRAALLHGQPNLRVGCPRWPTIVDTTQRICPFALQKIHAARRRRQFAYIGCIEQA
mmetsp:Transcript_29112/g.69076  ORF Transcript_29112/g.69076 Transcript_29112/m.69076 type:complete len:227 (-) Transcript_29112:3023-3703(-)